MTITNLLEHINALFPYLVIQKYDEDLPDIQFDNRYIPTIKQIENVEGRVVRIGFHFELDQVGCEEEWSVDIECDFRKHSINYKLMELTTSNNVRPTHTKNYYGSDILIK